MGIPLRVRTGKKKEIENSGRPADQPASKLSRLVTSWSTVPNFEILKLLEFCSRRIEQQFSPSPTHGVLRRLIYDSALNLVDTIARKQGWY